MLCRSVLPGTKKAPAGRAGGLKDRITPAFIMTVLCHWDRPEPTVVRLNPMLPKPAFVSLDRVSLALTADPWAVRPGPAVSLALAGSAGFQVSAPNPASADRYVVGCDFLDRTFLLLLCWSFSIVGKVVTILLPLI
jgi:hypothetical protein